MDKYAHHIYPVADTFAYCLMPNHLHLMIRVRSEKELLSYLKVKKGRSFNLQGSENLGGLVSQQFSNLFNAYTKTYNLKFDRKGSLFAPNYKRKLIASEAYFMRLIAYIHNNPVIHGFSKSTEDWPYSSYQTYFSETDTKICRREGLAFFGSRETFRAVHRDIDFDQLAQVLEV